MSTTQKADSLRTVRKGPLNELTDMQVQEIALCARAINGRRLLVRKSDDMDKIKLQPQAKAALQMALADLHDKTGAALAIASGADEDEGADESGAETMSALAKAISDMASGVASQYGKKPEPGADKKDDEEMEKAKKPFPGAAPPFGSDGKPAKDAEKKETKKGEEGTTAVEGSTETVEKAGQVLSAKNKALVKACADALKALMSAAGMSEEEMMEKSADAGSSEVAKAQAAFDGVLTKALEEKLAPIAKSIEAIEKASVIEKAANPATPGAAKDADLPGSNAGGKTEPVHKGQERLSYNPMNLGESFGPKAKS